MKHKKEDAGGEKKYIGAEWIGGECVSSDFGTLENGKIYPLKEEVAKNSNGWKPIYKEIKFSSKGE